MALGNASVNLNTLLDDNYLLSGRKIGTGEALIRELEKNLAYLKEFKKQQSSDDKIDGAIKDYEAMLSVAMILKDEQIPLEIDEEAEKSLKGLNERITESLNQKKEVNSTWLEIQKAYKEKKNKQLASSTVNAQDAAAKQKRMEKTDLDESTSIESLSNREMNYTDFEKLIIQTDQFRSRTYQDLHTNFEEQKKEKDPKVKEIEISSSAPLGGFVIQLNAINMGVAVDKMVQRKRNRSIQVLKAAQNYDSKSDNTNKKVITIAKELIVFAAISPEFKNEMLDAIKTIRDHLKHLNNDNPQGGTYQDLIDGLNKTVETIDKQESEALTKVVITTNKSDANKAIASYDEATNFRNYRFQDVELNIDAQKEKAENAVAELFEKVGDKISKKYKAVFGDRVEKNRKIFIDEMNFRSRSLFSNYQKAFTKNGYSPKDGASPPYHEHFYDVSTQFATQVEQRYLEKQRAAEAKLKESAQGKNLMAKLKLRVFPVKPSVRKLPKASALRSSRFHRRIDGGMYDSSQKIIKEIFIHFRENSNQITNSEFLSGRMIQLAKHESSMELLQVAAMSAKILCTPQKIQKNTVQVDGGSQNFEETIKAAALEIGASKSLDDMQKLKVLTALKNSISLGDKSDIQKIIFKQMNETIKDTTSLSSMIENGMKGPARDVINSRLSSDRNPSREDFNYLKNLVAKHNLSLDRSTRKKLLDKTADHLRESRLNDTFIKKIDDQKSSIQSTKKELDETTKETKQQIKELHVQIKTLKGSLSELKKALKLQKTLNSLNEEKKPVFLESLTENDRRLVNNDSVADLIGQKQQAILKTGQSIKELETKLKDAKKNFVTRTKECKAEIKKIKVLRAKLPKIVRAFKRKYTINDYTSQKWNIFIDAKLNDDEKDLLKDKYEDIMMLGYSPDAEVRILDDRYKTNEQKKETKEQTKALRKERIASAKSTMTSAVKKFKAAPGWAKKTVTEGINKAKKKLQEVKKKFEKNIQDRKEKKMARHP